MKLNTKTIFEAYLSSFFKKENAGDQVANTNVIELEGRDFIDYLYTLLDYRILS